MIRNVCSINIDLKSLKPNTNIKEIFREYITKNGIENDRKKVYLIRIINSLNGLKKIKDELIQENRIIPYAFTMIKYFSGYRSLVENMNHSNKLFRVLDTDSQKFNHYIFLTDDVSMISTIENLNAMKKHIYLVTSKKTMSNFEKTIPNAEIAVYDDYFEDYDKSIDEISRINGWKTGREKNVMENFLWYTMNKVVEGLNTGHNNFLCQYYHSPYIMYEKRKKLRMLEWVLDFED